LVVEDDRAIALGLEDDLTLEGYAVEVVRDGEAALARAGDGGIDLVLLDVMLPRKDGFAVCRELRRRGVHVPIIMVTAKTHEAEKILGLELGADDYVTKPFSPAELRARIKSVLRRTAGEGPATASFGDVEVDFAAFELRRGGALVHATPTELKLLLAFVRHPGRVLSRQELVDLVWGPGRAITPRVVDTHVANLRQKVEPDPAGPRYIVGVRGVGYRFDA
jgi:two-component system alkaline phosphatase synthesis response regulator PhoP/two-component system response regulator VicR